MPVPQFKPESKADRLASWVDRPPPSRMAWPLRWLHSLARVVMITIIEANTNNLSLRSAALTFTILLSMVPILAMSTAVVKGLGGGNELKEIVYKYIDTLDLASPDVASESGPPSAGSPSPPESIEQPAGLAGHLRSAVDQLFDYVDRTNFATLGTFGMLGIFLSVILVLNHIEAAMNTIWHVEDGRSILRKISDYLTLIILLPISINVAFAAGAIVESQSLALQIERFFPADWIKLLVLKGVPVFFLSATLFIVYLFFPNTRLKTVPAVTGAFFAGSTWFAIQNIYISMQIGVAKYNAIYGSFATVPLFLVWIYLGCLFVLLGAQLAYALQNNRRYQILAKRPSAALQLSAALDMNALVRSRFQDGKGTAIDDIHQAFPVYETGLLEEMRDALVGAGILHHSSENGKIMPSQPPETVSPRQIVDAVLFTEPPETEGGRSSRHALAAAGKAVDSTAENDRPGTGGSGRKNPRQAEE